MTPLCIMMPQRLYWQYLALLSSVLIRNYLKLSCMASVLVTMESILGRYFSCRIGIASNEWSRNEELSKVEGFLSTFSRISHSCYKDKSLIVFPAEKIMLVVLQEKTYEGPWVDLNPESSRSNRFSECNWYTWYYCRFDHIDSRRCRNPPSACHNPKKWKPFCQETAPLDPSWDAYTLPWL